jgi:hypothetical protein
MAWFGDFFLLADLELADALGKDVCQPLAGRQTFFPIAWRVHSICYASEAPSEHCKIWFE